MNDVPVTLAVLTVLGLVGFCNEYILGRAPQGMDLPVFMQEAAGLHALRIFKGWTNGEAQSVTRHVEIRAGTSLVNHQIDTWPHTGACALYLRAVSRMSYDNRFLRGQLRTEASLRPLYISEDFGGKAAPADMATCMGLAGRSRTIVIPRRPSSWLGTLPVIPLRAGELKELLKDTDRQDRLAAFGLLVKAEKA